MASRPTSPCDLQVCATLIAIPKLVNADVLPALLPGVVSLLEHPQEVVRKKAVMVLHRFHAVSPSCAVGLSGKLRLVLCDKDPAVMGASLHILHEMAEAEPAAHKDLVRASPQLWRRASDRSSKLTPDGRASVRAHLGSLGGPPVRNDEWRALAQVPSFVSILKQITEHR